MRQSDRKGHWPAVSNERTSWHSCGVRGIHVVFVGSKLRMLTWMLPTI